jgi:hypothetical protein
MVIANRLEFKHDGHFYSGVNESGCFNERLKSLIRGIQGGGGQGNVIYQPFAHSNLDDIGNIRGGFSDISIPPVLDGTKFTWFAGTVIAAILIYHRTQVAGSHDNSQFRRGDAAGGDTIIESRAGKKRNVHVFVSIIPNFILIAAILDQVQGRNRYPFPVDNKSGEQFPIPGRGFKA